MPKALLDSISIFKIYFKVIQGNFIAYMVMMPAFPLVFLLFARSITPEGSELSSRLITGSLVLGLGITTGNNLSQTILDDRFNFRLKLLVASPVHPLAYAAGVIAFTALYGLAMAEAILLFAPLFGISIHLSLWLIPMLLITLLITIVSMTGIGLIIATWAPSSQIGNLLAITVGIMVVMLSPIYYEIDRLPCWLQIPAEGSPYTRAGNAIDSVLSGTGVAFDETWFAGGDLDAYGWLGLGGDALERGVMFGREVSRREAALVSDRLVADGFVAADTAGPPVAHGEYLFLFQPGCDHGLA